MQVQNSTSKRKRTQTPESCYSIKRTKESSSSPLPLQGKEKAAPILCVKRSEKEKKVPGIILSAVFFFSFI